MKLTPEQRAALEAVCGTVKDGGAYEHIFLAGLRMGRAEGREEAAKACDEYSEISSPVRARVCAVIIRALRDEEPT